MTTPSKESHSIKTLGDCTAVSCLKPLKSHISHTDWSKFRPGGVQRAVRDVLPCLVKEAYAVEDIEVVFPEFTQGQIRVVGDLETPGKKTLCIQLKI
ncbi:hypothetical protein SK128_006243 [Halocaridina rubra]|uniref:Uncharacterized protein n=1 Tax=Halocaridina rubra TaxID=373956 RepID=A0AAN8XRP5_HALRR